MRPERFARGAEQSRHARRRARQDSGKPGAAGAPDRSRPRQARRAFLIGSLFGQIAGTVSRGAGCMTMRIAYVCADPGVPVFGRKGCSVHVQEMLRALQGHGAGVDLFAARVDEAPPSGLESLPIHHLTPVGDGDPSSHAAAIAALNDQLAALLDRAGPYDLVYERYSLWSLAAMEHAATAGVPGLLEVNAPLIEEQAAYRGLRDAAGADRVAARAFRAASVLLAVSAEVAAWLERRGVARGERGRALPGSGGPARGSRAPDLGRRGGCPLPSGDRLLFLAAQGV